MADMPVERVAAPAAQPRRLPGQGRTLFVAALAVAATELALFVLYRTLFAHIEGTTIAGQSFPNYVSWYPEIVFAALIAYFIVLPRYSLGGALRDLEDLRPALACSDAEFEQLRGSLGQGGARRVGPMLLAGALVGAAITFYPGIWVGGRTPGVADPELSWGLLRNPLTLALAARACFFEIDLARSFSRLGRDWVQVDLLDLEPLAPFVRRGLRTAFGFLLLVSLVVLLVRAVSKLDVLILFLLISCGVGLSALLLPMGGAHARMRAAKQAELDRVRSAIRSERQTLWQPHQDEVLGGSRLSQLLAYEARVERVREWPFDTPTLLRFALYLALPLGSWLGGAIVERLLGAVLD